jgi:hypothetical protein
MISNEMGLPVRRQLFGPASVHQPRRNMEPMRLHVAPGSWAEQDACTANLIFALRFG